MASKISGEEKDRILKSLTTVGITKAIGYLPLYTIYDFLEMTTQELSEQALNRGLSTRRFESDECCIKSGAFYVYDQERLITIIEASTSILWKEDWPLDPDLFIEAIAQNWLELENPVLPIIRQAFGDLG